MVAPTGTIKYTGGSIQATLTYHQANENVWAVDIDNGCGTPVFATVDGTVILKQSANNIQFFGNNYVVIKDANGYYHLFGHMQSKTVTNGQQVKAGDIIGEVGTQGNSTGCHLHYSITNNEADVDRGGQPLNVPLEQSFVYKFLGGAQLVKVDSSQIVISNSNGHLGQTLVHNNQLPTDIPSIVPEKICFVFSGKVDPNDWSLLFPIHSNNVGIVHGNVEIPKTGNLERVIFVNHSSCVVAYQDIGLDVTKGDLLNFDFTYTLQNYLSCSEINYNKSKELMHQMTEYTLDWLDGHEANEYNNKDYNKLTEGTGDGSSSYNALSNELGTGASVGSSPGSNFVSQGLTNTEQQVLKALEKYLPSNLNTKIFISAIMGNIMQESGMDQNVVNSIGASGLCQWLGNRLNELLTSNNANSISDVDVDKQIKFAILELTRDVIPTYGTPTIDTLENATNWWCDNWERPGVAEANKPHRLSYAKNYFGAITGTTTTPPKQATTGRLSGNFVRR